MIKVFIPHQSDGNIYLDQIICYSEATYYYGNYKNFKDDYAIVNIQFPEAIFNWELPTREQLRDLEKNFILWKEKAKIVCTMNDFRKHYDNNVLFVDLFKLVHQYADGVIHLGDFSLNKYKKYFSPLCMHTVVYHPIYDSLLNNFKTKNIQEFIPFDLKDKYIVSSIGSIRSREEMKMILNFFKKIPKKNKVLIVPRMTQFSKTPSYVPYRYRKQYRKFVDFLNFYSVRNEFCYLDNKFIEYPYIVDLIKKTSLMIIPRVANLNSGNLFLGITFDKNMAVPKGGNLTEVLDRLKIPAFNFGKISKLEVKNFVLLVENEKYFEQLNYKNNKEIFHPCNIAKEQDNFFKLICSK
jgi:hypothetical protein